MANLFRPGALRWTPDADAQAAPEGSLLVATNLVPDTSGGLALRRGSEILYEDLETSGEVHTLYTSELADGTTYRIAGVDNAIYVNGVPQFSGMTGSGDFAVGDDSHQIFIARGTTKKKWDGTAIYNWSLSRPVAKPTLDAVDETTTTVADFNNSESPAVTIVEGSGTVGGESDQGGNANEATKVTPSGNNQGVLQRLWTSDQDFFDISGLDGSETDLISLFIKLEKPRNVDSITLVFGCDNSSTEPFETNRFEFTFDIKGGLDIAIKDLASEGYAAYESVVSKTVGTVKPWEVSGFQNPGKVKDTLSAVGSKPSPKSKAPKDDVWSELTVSRGQFERFGSDEARGWDTIRGFKVIYRTLKGKTADITVSDAIVVGGGDRSLTGTFRCVVQAVREVKDSNGNVRYYEKSPPSPESDKINLNHQSIQITVDSTTLNALDEQADQLWVYLWGGWLDAYYRFAVAPADISQGMTIDELTTPAGSNLDEVAERARFSSWGYTYSQLNGSGVPELTASTDFVLTLRKGEMDALTENIRLDPYLVGCPNNTVDVAGPWRSRMFVLTSEGYVYPSLQNSPSAFNSLQVLDLSQYGDAMWIAKTGSGIYVGMEKDVIYLAGSGDNSPDLARIDLYGQPLNIGNPPVDICHWVEGNSILYRSTDGMQTLVGSSVSPVPFAGTGLLWRGQDRHSISALNVETGRFRATMDNGMLYLIVSEGSNTTDNVIYRYNGEQWSRLVFDQAGNLLSIFNEPDGTLIAGDDDGNVWELESGTLDDNTNVFLDMLTPIDSGGQPLAAKDPFDVQLHINTGGSSISLDVYKDGDEEDPTTYTVLAATQSIWRQQLTDLGPFVKAQMRLYGSAGALDLSGYNIFYRPRPQRTLSFDTGYYLPPQDGDYLWMQEVELDAIVNSSTFTAYVYVEDVLVHTSDTTTATTGVRTIYRLPLPRGTKGPNIRVVFKASDTSGTGTIGMDPYRVRVRVSGSGNDDRTRGYVTIWPGGEMP